jgi:tRNA threonylcarbamoyl adenosine modification protein YjeE
LPNIKKQIIDLIVDGGNLPHNKPSTVVDLTQPKIKILRPGDIVFTDEKTFVSGSPIQTKKLAQYLIKKLLSKLSKPLVIIIEGELGVGKTIFIKGLAEYFGITNIISPSFVIYYEYSMKHFHFNKLIHFDLYNIEDRTEFRYLGIKDYLKKGNLLVFEWGEKAGEIYGLLRSRAEIVYIKMEYVNEKERRIKVNL